MKYLPVLISLIGLFVLAGCGGAVPEPVTPTVEASATPPLVAPTDAQPEATATSESYPADAEPEPTIVPDDYPAPETPALPTAYPADMMVWMQQAWGTQCEDAETYAYADLTEAVAALEDAGVTVQASEAVERAVCQACDCPTSEHFRVQVSAQDIEQAQELGWTRE